MEALRRAATWRRGHHDRAVQQCREALEHTLASGDALFTGLLLGIVGWLLFEKGDLAGARATKVESLAILRNLDAREAVGLALLGLAHEMPPTRSECVRTSRKVLQLLQATGSPGVADWLTLAYCW